MPEKLLFLAALERAALDALGIDPCGVPVPNRRCLQHEALAWFASNAIAPGSFRWLCEMLNLEPSAVHRAIFQNGSRPALLSSRSAPDSRRRRQSAA